VPCRLVLSAISSQTTRVLLCASGRQTRYTYLGTMPEDSSAPGFFGVTKLDMQARAAFWSFLTVCFLSLFVFLVSVCLLQLWPSSFRLGPSTAGRSRHSLAIGR